MPPASDPFSTTNDPGRSPMGTAPEPTVHNLTYQPGRHIDSQKGTVFFYGQEIYLPVSSKLTLETGNNRPVASRSTNPAFLRNISRSWPEISLQKCLNSTTRTDLQLFALASIELARPGSENDHGTPLFPQGEVNAAQLRYRVLPTEILALFAHHHQLIPNELLSSDSETVNEVP